MKTFLKLATVTLLTLPTLTLANLGDGPSANRISCIDSPIRDLIEVVKESNDGLVKNHFNKDEAEWFTKTLDYNVIYYGVLSKFRNKPIHLHLKDDLMTMIMIKSAQKNADNPDPSVLNSYIETMREILSGESTKAQANHFISDYLDYSREIYENNYGGTYLGVIGRPYRDQAIVREIAKLTSDDLCTDEGKLIKKKKFIRLVRSKLTDEDLQEVVK